jgi:hypothetical protein
MMKEFNNEIDPSCLKGSLMKDGNIEITQCMDIWTKLSVEHGVPLNEIRLIDLNRSGVHLPNNEVKIDYRVRFVGSVGLEDKNNTTWFALPVRREVDTNFIASDNTLNFKNEVLSKTGPLILDTCDNHYQRGPNLLNLNSRSRGNCGGCKACVHNYKDLYDKTVLKDQHKLISKEEISTFFNQEEQAGLKIADLKQIAVVTGLFGSESAVVEHIKLINEVVKPMGFKGELMYFGCEVNSEIALEELAKTENFALIYAIDNFTKRNKILAKSKSLISIDMAKKTLDLAKQKGIKTTFAYIAGIDSLLEMKNGFQMLMESITRFPVINIFQVQTPGQISAMNLEAKKLEYYVKARKIIEELFKETNMIPIKWENYRPLWYEMFNNKPLPKNAFGD